MFNGFWELIPCLGSVKAEGLLPCGKATFITKDKSKLSRTLLRVCGGVLDFDCLV